MALSGLASRLHAIYTYTFPPQHATAAAEELIRLYVQKGHDSAACRRFLKKVLPLSFTCADSGILCASTPVSKGPFYQPILQGATAPFISLWPTKLLMFGEDMNLGRQVHVPATGLNFCSRCSSLSCLFPWWFHDTSPKPFFLQPRSTATFSSRAFSAVMCKQC